MARLVLLPSVTKNHHGMAVGVTGAAGGQDVGGHARPYLSTGCARGAAIGGNVHGQAV